MFGQRVCLLVPLTGLADLIKVVGPPAIQAVVCRLAHAVIRVHCCVQKAKSEGVAHGVHYQSNPLPP